MKKNLHLVYLLVISALIISCTENEELIGKWSDIIKLSTKKVEFDANANSVTITTEGDSWWVNGIAVDDEYFIIPSDINTLSDKYIIQQDCFIVERKDKNTLYIEIDENETIYEKRIVVELEAGNYFDRVIITQSGR